MAWDRRRRGPREHASYPDVRERLTEAFKAMRKKGILARQNFSCCGGCGSYELATKMDESRAAGRPKRGAIYYHRQSAERLRKSGEVYLGFGCDSNAPEVDGDRTEDERTRLVGCYAIEALNAAGLEVEWNGTAIRCILVKGVKEEAA